MMKRKKFLISLVIVLVAIGIIFVIFSMYSIQIQKTREYLDQVAEGTYVVEPLSYKAIEFTVPYFYRNPRLYLSVVEQTDKDIIVKVIDQRGTIYYDSGGKVRDIYKVIYLDSGKSYYIILDNRYSIFTPKKVSVSATVAYNKY